MKVTSIAAGGVSLALIALTLAPSAGEYRGYFSIGALICAAVALVTSVVGWREAPSAAFVDSPSERPSAKPSTTGDAARALAVNAAPPPARAVSGEAQVVAFLATLQEKGRLVDFLQDDITGYSDAQVGAAARVVHQRLQVGAERVFPGRSGS